jgi:hypothetical protein
MERARGKARPPFVMSMFANKADLYEAKANYFIDLLEEALNEYAIKNDLSEAPENHWSRKTLDQISP